MSAAPSGGGGGLWPMRGPAANRSGGASSTIRLSCWNCPLDGSAGTVSDRPVLLVCTHARHDQCCAVRGRPVAQTLARAFPDETWESSHLGGDRFAATMIVLPHGLYYGRVPTTDAETIVERYLRR